MDILLVLGEEQNNLRFMLKVEDERTQRRIHGLIGRRRMKEAVNVLKKEGEVSRYLPKGARIAVHPDLTLIEDLL